MLFGSFGHSMQEMVVAITAATGCEEAGALFAWVMMLLQWGIITGGLYAIIQVVSWADNKFVQRPYAQKWRKKKSHQSAY